MATELMLAAEKVLNIFPKTLWYAILIILIVVVIILYIKYRKELNAK